MPIHLPRSRGEIRSAVIAIEVGTTPPPPMPVITPPPPRSGQPLKRGASPCLLPALESLLQRLEEPSRVRAVDQAMVVREREVHDRPDPDRLGPVRVLHDPRPPNECIRAEDRALRL